MRFLSQTAMFLGGGVASYVLLATTLNVFTHELLYWRPGVAVFVVGCALLTWGASNYDWAERR